MIGPNQGRLSLRSLDEQLPAEHLARFVAKLVDERLNLLPIWSAGTEARGAPPYDPRPMVRILLYGYTVGVRSSRVIARKSIDELPFRWLAAGSAPEYQAIIRFRRTHLIELRHLFAQALALCQAADMVRLVRVAQDRTRVRANFCPERLATALLADAERIDEVEDATFGTETPRAESPKHLRQGETRPATICEANAVPNKQLRRALVGAVLLALIVAGGYCVAVDKTVTLSVDGSPKTVSTMKSRVIDIVRDNGFAVGEHDELYPAANQPVRQSDTIV
ncbi:MAG TPA: transposase, partial [Mycobacterium sp.]|nr:transposase [Mycobacterium sp.]